MGIYNPKIHHRRSIRLKGYDYSQAGVYFVTMCCHGRQHRFGEVKNGEMELNEFGIIAYDQWAKLPKRFPYFELDVFQIMPNHVHAIIRLIAPQWVNPVHAVVDIEYVEIDGGICIGDGVGVGAGASPAPTPRPATIGDIVGAYKSLVSNECLKICKQNNMVMGKLWQRNYYENIVRNELAYKNISTYIRNNPKKWDEDRFYSH
jgi:putative transposase